MNANFVPAGIGASGQLELARQGLIDRIEAAEVFPMSEESADPPAASFGERLVRSGVRVSPLAR